MIECWKGLISVEEYVNMLKKDDNNVYEMVLLGNYYILKLIFYLVYCL